jgi:hypothetical protein
MFVGIHQPPKSKITATGSCRKAPKIAGSGSSIPTGIFFDFFRWIPVKFLCFPTGTGRKSSEKIRQISGENIASTFQRFSLLSCRNRPVIFDLGGDFIFLSNLKRSDCFGGKCLMAQGPNPATVIAKTAGKCLAMN